jgi:hypothetical protein
MHEKEFGPNLTIAKQYILQNSSTKRYIILSTSVLGMRVAHEMNNFS